MATPAGFEPATFSLEGCCSQRRWQRDDCDGHVLLREVGGGDAPWLR